MTLPTRVEIAWPTETTWTIDATYAEDHRVDNVLRLMVGYVLNLSVKTFPSFPIKTDTDNNMVLKP